MVKPIVRRKHSFVLTRRYRAILTDEQKVKFQKDIDVQNHLFNFTLSYLYHAFGVNNLQRKFPTDYAINPLINHIKAMFIKKFYGLDRWKFNVIGLCSHSADEFLKVVMTNFGLYHKELIKNSRMTDIERYNYKMNIQKNKKGKHTNPRHRSWYRIGSLNYLDLKHGDSFKTITTQARANRKNPTFKVLSDHFIRMSDMGTVQVIENVKNLDVEHITIIKLKRRTVNQFEIQFIYTYEKPRAIVEPELMIGVDWNMYENEILHTSEDKVYKLNPKIVKQADDLELKRRNLQCRLKKSQCGSSSLKQRQLANQIRKIYHKRSNLLTEEYRKLALNLVESTDTLVLESIGYKQLCYKSKAKGFNRKLALIKPYEMQQIILNAFHKRGQTVILVDSYKTSQVEYLTMSVQKHQVNEMIPGTKIRGWISEETQHEVVRDLNSALNIRLWGLFPEAHYKYLERKLKIRQEIKDKVPKYKRSKEIKPEYLVEII